MPCVDQKQILRGNINQTVDHGDGYGGTPKRGRRGNNVTAAGYSKPLSQCAVEPVL